MEEYKTFKKKALEENLIAYDYSTFYRRKKKGQTREEILTALKRKRNKKGKELIMAIDVKTWETATIYLKQRGKSPALFKERALALPIKAFIEEKEQEEGKKQTTSTYLFYILAHLKEGKSYSY